jgi:hypothetical protein
MATIEWDDEPRVDYTPTGVTLRLRVDGAPRLILLDHAEAAAIAGRRPHGVKTYRESEIAALLAHARQHFAEV